MKKFAVIIILIMFLVKDVYAQTSTPRPTTTTAPTRSTPTPTPSQEDAQIEKIKDLVASKVAELKLVDKRGLLGTVKNTTNTQIMLTDIKNKEVAIDIDELTKFEGEDDTFGISDIKEKDVISAIGLYNKDTERLLARYVSYAQNVPENFGGVVTGIDEEEFTITVLSENGEKRVVDIQTSTKTVSFEEGDTVKSGFSKIVSGERVIIVGFPDKNDAERINASRITRLPEIPLSSGLKEAISKENTTERTPTPEEE